MVGQAQTSLSPVELVATPQWLSYTLQQEKHKVTWDLKTTPIAVSQHGTWLFVLLQPNNCPRYTERNGHWKNLIFVCFLNCVQMFLHLRKQDPCARLCSVWDGYVFIFPCIPARGTSKQVEITVNQTLPACDWSSLSLSHPPMHISPSPFSIHGETHCLVRQTPCSPIHSVPQRPRAAFSHCEFPTADTTERIWGILNRSLLFWNP